MLVYVLKKKQSFSSRTGAIRKRIKIRTMGRKCLWILLFRESLSFGALAVSRPVSEGRTAKIVSHISVREGGRMTCPSLCFGLKTTLETVEVDDVGPSNSVRTVAS